MEWPHSTKRIDASNKDGRAVKASWNMKLDHRGPCQLESMK